MVKGRNHFPLGLEQDENDCFHHSNNIVQGILESDIR